VISMIAQKRFFSPAHGGKKGNQESTTGKGKSDSIVPRFSGKGAQFTDAAIIGE